MAKKPTTPQKPATNAKPQTAAKPAATAPKAAPRTAPTKTAEPAKKPEPTKKPDTPAAAATKVDPKKAEPKKPVQTKTLPPTLKPGLPALLMLVVGLVGLFGAIIAEETLGLQPCVLCVFARVPFAVLALLGLFGLAIRNWVLGARTLIILGGVVMLISSALGGYHFAVEQQWVEMSSVCQIGTGSANPTSLSEMLAQSAAAESLNRCDQTTWLIKGVSVTVYNFIGSLVLGLVLLLMGLKLTGPRIVEVK